MLQLRHAFFANNSFMKNVYFYLGTIIMMMFISCKNRNTGSLQIRESVKSSIVFIDTIHHFGNVSMENPVDSFDFKFRNTGTQNVVVLNASTSCQCTEVRYSTKPVTPGDESFIRVIYNGKGRSPEYFRKYVLVYTSAAQENVKLVIDGQLQK